MGQSCWHSEATSVVSGGESGASGRRYSRLRALIEIQTLGDRRAL
jgi:hypothetical protein